MRSSDSQYAAAGTDPPWPPLLKGGKGRGAPFLRGGNLAQQTRRETAAPRIASFQQPTLAPPSEGSAVRVLEGVEGSCSVHVFDCWSTL